MPWLLVEQQLHRVGVHEILQLNDIPKTWQKEGMDPH